MWRSTVTPFRSYLHHGLTNQSSALRRRSPHRGYYLPYQGKFVSSNETFLFDFPTARWTKLVFKHDFVPAERAAHAAVAVSDMQLIIYGGAASGNQGLLKDELYILDLRKEYF